jgi:Prokaryotic RING finger family 1
MTAQPHSSEPHQRVAGQAETGRPCPYCRFPLKEGVPMVQCGVCGASHHDDCWQDNAGCAVVACAGGPNGEPQGRAAPPVPTQVLARTQLFAEASPLQQPAGPPPPADRTGARSGERRTPSLAIAIVLLALAVGGAAIAIVVSRQSKPLQLLANNGGQSTSSEVGSESASSSTPEVVREPSGSGSTNEVKSDGDTETPGGTGSESSGLLPAGESTDQMAPEIQDMLREFHTDVVSGDYRSAWNLMSARKQHQSLEKYGYAGWVSNQSTLRPYLDPSGLTVSIEETNPSNGVATVDVTGMGWNKPGASCSEWSGITWVKYEAGAWRYDPGYSTSPQREREWKSRYSELLGGQC